MKKMSKETAKLAAEMSGYIGVAAWTAMPVGIFAGLVKGYLPLKILATIGGLHLASALTVNVVEPFIDQMVEELYSNAPATETVTE